MSFTNLFGDLITVAGLSAIIIGTFFIKNEFLIFAGFVGVLFSFGKSLADLHGLVSAQISPVVAWFTISPIIIIYLITLISFWRRG